MRFAAFSSRPLGQSGNTTKTRVRCSSLIACGVLFLSLLVGCRSVYGPGYRPGSIPADTGPRTTSYGVPDWVGEPLSWDKLAEVQAWLDIEGSSASDFWRVEAMLEIAQGRLEFSLRDRESQQASEAALASRLALARQGFEDVLADPTATADQTRRARAGRDVVARSLKPSLKTGRPIFARAQWGALNARPSRLTRATGRWTRITVHHSAEAYAPVLDGSAASSAQAIRRIQQHMMNGLDYGDIGYHFVIDPEGRVFEGRSMAWQGAHAAGSNNIENIGVCVLGNFEEGRPTPQALVSLQSTLNHMRQRYRIPRSGVVAHGDLKNTLCPGRSLTAWLRQYQ